MRLPQTAFIADGLYLFVGKAEHIFCLRDSPVHQVAADTDTKLLPEHASQIVFTDKKMLCQKIQAYFLLIMLIQVLLYRKYILFFQICIPVFFSRVPGLIHQKRQQIIQLTVDLHIPNVIIGICQFINPVTDFQKPGNRNGVEDCSSTPL